MNRIDIYKLVRSVVSLFVLAVIVSGCGGGGGGSSTPTSDTITGTLVNSANQADLSGYTVWVGGTQESTSTSSGTFSFTLSTTIVATSPTLTIENSTGAVVKTITLTSANTSLGTISISVPTNDIVSGTLINTSNSAPLSGYTVWISGVSGSIATSNSLGVFSFTLSSATLATSPELLIENPSGTVVYTATLTSSQANGSGVVPLGNIDIQITGSSNIIVTGSVYDFFKGNPLSGENVLLNGNVVATTASSGTVGSFTFTISSSLLASSPTFSVAGADSGANGAQSLTPSEVVDGTINLGQVNVILANEGAPPVN